MCRSLQMHDGVPDLSVILVSFNTARLLDPVLEALRRSIGSRRAEIIVVDNASSDDSVTIMRVRHSDCRLIVNPINVGFGRANNQAAQFARGRYILLLNTDAFVCADTIDRTLTFMDDHPTCGILGVKLVGSDGGVQPSCRFFPTPWNTFLQATGMARLFPRTQLVDDVDWDPDIRRECDWVPGCYYLIRREVIDRVGLFDPRYFLYCEEVDHCWSVKNAGWQVVYFPDTTVCHLGGESARALGPVTATGRQISALQIESELLFFRKHLGRVGLATAVALSAIAQLLLATKAIIRRRSWRLARDEIRYFTSLSRIVLRSDFGTKPTR